MPLNSTRRAAALSGALALALGVSACGSSDSDAGSDETGTEIDCAPYEAFGDLDGTTVTVYTSITAPEDEPHIASYKPFENCTGVTIKYEGSKEFEAQLPVRVQGGNAPDIAYLPQPGLLQTMVATGKVVAPPQEVEDNVDANMPDFKEYGTVDGTFYAAPLGANVKSFVWYSPQMFADGGYEIPTTWDELMSLTQQIASDNPDSKPWCAGIESGDATGWPATDWIEDVMLRTAGAETYDKWVNHEIPFNDASVAEALNEVGKILKNPDYVNGGYGDVKTIATTSFQDAGLPVLDGSCYMHRQASFYAANWPEGTNVAEDGDVWAFYLPAMTAEEHPVLGGGEFVAAFADRPEVKAFQTYLSSVEWADERARTCGSGGCVTANKNADASLLENPVDKLSAEQLTDPNATFRFDASDLMPGAVGAGTFWKGMTDWIIGQDDQTTLDYIEKSWPKS
ncbi:carbohydrate ABC transporter substrate-binding protein [Phycicoccus endophyticus]|uniref:Carbohydrate ABC transporter substrate-binding protein n=1 Tax=Phycicoccus endophyticus TaxID=1690220 RepID=A0A7G9R4W3_9MICO|nr:ABC transporter substrate-binding protein [Phycicoccus endophyticus]NHI18564.1 carbohydrate ABC transporter substrate-binding protein [Phycicoccus endophyticus]QNN50638.1 carbohydrate ABC transporter substrate-binding protein [Phycicoccus endophyticus]GGL22772.1 alpha-glucosides-binding periplasmic protein AglE [Phycicoccus endophyticus]